MPKAVCFHPVHDTVCLNCFENYIMKLNLIDNSLNKNTLPASRQLSIGLSILAVK